MAIGMNLNQNSVKNKKHHHLHLHPMHPSASQTRIPKPVITTIEQKQHLHLHYRPLVHIKANTTNKKIVQMYINPSRGSVRNSGTWAQISLILYSSTSVLVGRRRQNYSMKHCVNAGIANVILPQSSIQPKFCIHGMSVPVIGIYYAYPGRLIGSSTRFKRYKPKKAFFDVWFSR